MASQLAGVMAKPGRAEAARSMKSCMASHRVISSRLVAFSGSESDGTCHLISPARSSGSRLVARIRTRSLPRSKPGAACAHACFTCSQLSRMISVLVPSRLRFSASIAAIPCSNLTPTAAAMASTTNEGSLKGARSTKRTPSGKVSSAPTWVASRVLPHPPGPTSVMQRCDSSSDRSSSRSRPTNDVSCTGKFCRKLPSDFRGGKSTRSCGCAAERRALSRPHRASDGVRDRSASRR